MKRLFGGSCLRLLLLISLGGMAALFAFTIFFQQSQAVTSNASQTIESGATATRTVRPPTTVPVQSILQSLTPPSPGDVIIQIEPEVTETIQGFSTKLPDNYQILTSTPTPQSLITPTDAPRHSGTSSYPLTVTAEVMFAQTNVANYQAVIAATRTAIAAESEIIYATLTAGAPTQGTAP